MSTVQIGITLIGILTGIYSGDKITTDVEVFFASYAMTFPYAHSLAVGVVVVVLTFFSLVLGELLPNRIGLNHPEGYCESCCCSNENDFNYNGAFYLVVNCFYRWYF